jgi:hypothetical protein
MNRGTDIGLLDRLHAGVPGDNRIAGNYRGLEEVIGYFRRDLADHTFHMGPQPPSRRNPVDAHQRREVDHLGEAAITLTVT